MLITPEEIKIIKEMKENSNNYHECPYCKEKIKIGVEFDTKKKIHNKEKFPYPHLHLHGNPIHGMLCYIDSSLQVRSIGVIESIEISRDSDTLNQLMKKWANPY